jgi:hypothetical protein
MWHECEQFERSRGDDPLTRVPLLAVVACLAAQPSAAQVTEPLFVHRADAAAAAMQAPAGGRPAILSRTTVGLRIDRLFDSRGAVSRVLLNVGDETWTARFERLDTDAGGFRSWVGAIDGISDSHVVFTERLGVMSGLINAVGKTYQVRTEARGTYLLELVDVARLGGERDPIVVANAQPGSLLANGVAADSGSTIDVLMLYTPSARDQRGGTASMQALVSQIISDTNTAFSRSNIQPRVRLVAAVELAVDESPSMFADLEAISSSQEVRLLRDAARADLVQLLVNSPDLSACGIGHLLTSLNATNFSAFSVADLACAAQYTPTHEMGHNLGSHHAPEDGAFGALFDYSYGFKDAARSFRTVMAYDCAGAPCGRILSFSNPRLTHDGGPTGTLLQDNARSINDAASVVANFRQAIPSPTEMPPAPPPHLASSVVGTSVSVWWEDVPAASAYLLQVGTSPGSADVLSRSVYGAVSASGVVADGTYYWRVFAINADGPSAPSADAQFTTGVSCVAPSPPRDFVFAVAGGHVTLAWTPPATGSAPMSYVVEAGTGAGLANLLVASTGPLTAVGTPAPPGTYFVRIRAQNACGTSSPSNEQIVTVP